MYDSAARWTGVDWTTRPPSLRRARVDDGVGACYSPRTSLGGLFMRLSALLVVRLALVGVVACAAGPADATVVVVPTLEEMTWRSDVIVHAVVVDQQVLEQKKGRVVTRTVLEVEDAVAGAFQKDLVIVEQLGGELGARRSWISGAHKFKVGDEVLLFGQRITNIVGESVVVPYGIGFGIFDIVEDVDGKHAVERGGDVAQLVRDDQGGSSMKPVTPRHFTSVEVFKDQLRAILEGRQTLVPPSMKILRPKLPARPGTTAPTTTTTKTTTTTTATAQE